MLLSGTTRDRNDAALIPGRHQRGTSSLLGFPKIVSPHHPRARGSGQGTGDPTSDPDTSRRVIWAPRPLNPRGNCLDPREAQQAPTPALGAELLRPSPGEGAALGRGGGGSFLLGSGGFPGSFRARLGEVTSNSPQETTFPPRRRHPGSTRFLETSSLATVARL